ncbi:putative reverse transcriptase domain-containing protein [Tanacetum coccineum]
MSVTIRTMHTPNLREHHRTREGMWVGVIGQVIMELEDMEMEEIGSREANGMGKKELLGLTRTGTESTKLNEYATCTSIPVPLNMVVRNSHKRTIRIEAAYAMSWAELMKLMTMVYCPRNEIQKMETELWNLVVKGNDLTAYTRRFQELGNVIATEPTKLQDAIRIANNLIDQKLKGYARSAINRGKTTYFQHIDFN